MKHTPKLQLVLTGTGFAAFLGMNSFSLWGLSFLPQFAFGESAYTYWITSITLCNIATFFFYVFGATYAPRFFDRAPFIEAVLFLSLGMIFLLGFFLFQSLIMLTLAGVLAGIGTTCCFICWEQVFALSEEREAQKQIILGSLLAIIPFSSFLMLSQSVLPFVMLLFVFCNLTLLYGCLRFRKEENQSKEKTPTVSSLSLQMGKEVWKPLICIVMIGVISPVLGSVAFSGEREFFESSIIVLCANTVTAIILSIAWFVLGKRVTLSKTYAVIFPVLITVLLLFPFLDEAYRTLVLFVGSLGFTLFSIVMMMSCIVISRERQISLVLIYSLFAGVTYASRFLGEGLASVVKESSLPQETQIITSVFVLLYGCSLVMFFLMRKTKGKNEFSKQEGSADALKVACWSLAEEYKFSDRQTEVLDLLVHGYDVPSIAKKLYISENTVRSHTKKIYAILEVHSKQEIIALVNNDFER